MKTCHWQSNVQRFFSVVKIENFIEENLIFLMFMLKTLMALIVGTNNLHFG